jgi:hypothetical protein
VKFACALALPSASRVPAERATALIIRVQSRRFVVWGVLKTDSLSFRAL